MKNSYYSKTPEVPARHDPDHHLKLFSANFERIARKYEETEWFLLGVGVSHSYLPQVIYNGISSLDLSHLATSIDRPNGASVLSGGTALKFVQNFENESFQSITLQADVDYFYVDISIPEFSSSREINFGVNIIGLNDPARRALVSSTVKSEVKTDFDLQFKLSTVDFLNRFLYTERKDKLSGSVDGGVGIGMTAISIENTITSDIRFSSSDLDTFTSLPPGELVTSKTKNSFKASYVSAYLNLTVGDELRVFSEIRWYRKDSEFGGDVDIDDISLSVGFYHYFL